MKKKFGKKRYFLNADEGVAAASFNVEVEADIAPKKDYWPTIDMSSGIQLSDCSRQISLEFDIWISDKKIKTLKNIRERRAKLQRLKDIVNEFAEATNEAYDYLESQLDAYHQAYAEKEKKEKAKKGKKK